MFNSKRITHLEDIAKTHYRFLSEHGKRMDDAIHLISETFDRQQKRINKLEEKLDSIESELNKLSNFLDNSNCFYGLDLGDENDIAIEVEVVGGEN